MFQRQLAAKKFDDIPNFTKDEIHLVSYNPDSPPSIVGSYSFRLQKYPADIDLMDNVNTYNVHGQWDAATNPNQIVTSFAKRIKQIANDIKQKKEHYLLDFKAGADYRYIFPMGDMDNGVLTFDTGFMDNIKGRLSEGLYTKEDYDAIVRFVDIAKREIGGGQVAYDGITKILRKYYILRWKLDEIIKGVKQLSSGSSVTLEDALKQHQLVKLDLAVMIRGRLVELSNIWSLFYYDIERHQYVYMTPLPKLENVPFDIEKLYWSDMFFSPYKVIKRMFSYARLKYLRGETHYEKYLRTLVGIISGDVSNLYQIKSELATILDVHELYGHVAPKSTDRQIDEMKSRLANNLRIPDDTLERLIDMLDQYLTSGSSESHESMMGKLEGVKNVLTDIVNKFAIDFLIKVGMNPPPHDFLPTHQSASELTNAREPMNPFCPIQHQRTYNWSVLRQPITVRGTGGFYNRMMLPRVLSGDTLEDDTIARLRAKSIIQGQGGCLTCGGVVTGCACCNGGPCMRMGEGVLGGDWTSILSDVGKEVLLPLLAQELSRRMHPQVRSNTSRVNTSRVSTRTSQAKKRGTLYTPYQSAQRRYAGLNEMTDIDFAIRGDTGMGPGLLKGLFRGL